MSFNALTGIIPQSIRALHGFSFVGQKRTGEIDNAKQNVSDAVAALEHMALAAATLFGFYKLTGGLSFAAVNANRLYSAAVAVGAFFFSPSGAQVTAGAFLAREGALRALAIYKDVALRSFKPAAIALASLGAGLVLLAKSEPMSKADKANDGVGDRLVVRPIANWAASKLVWEKTT
jgi:hypothetical protein